jgi:hypothetical protein
MGFKLGDVSPLAGMMTGEGLTGKLMRQGLGGMIPAMIAKDAYKDREEERRKAEAAGVSNAAAPSTGMAPASAMKKGGAVKASSASKRADGCAQRGKTRGKML